MSTIASPFARSGSPVDDIENVPDFDEYQQKAPNTNLVTDALSRDERHKLLAPGARSSLSELAPISLSTRPTQDRLRVHGEAKLDSTEALCCCASEDGRFLAAGCRNGSSVIYRLPENTGTSQEPVLLNQVYELRPQDATSPTTSLTWLNTRHESARYMLTSAQAGVINLHHATTQKLLSVASLPDSRETTFSSQTEKVLTLSSCSVPESHLLAAGGSEGTLVLYKASGSALTYTETLRVPGSQSGGGAAKAHSNRILAIEWSPTDANLLFTGGWDLTVKMWDIRTQRPELTIEGPYICGRGLAVNEDSRTLVTASWRPEHPLQIWDLRMGQLSTNLPVSQGKAPSDKHMTSESDYVHAGALRLYCVTWMSRNTLLCGGSADGECVKAVSVDGSFIANAPPCGVAMDVFSLNCTEAGPSAAIATSSGLSLVGASFTSSSN